MKNKMIYRKKGWMLTAMLGFCLGGSVTAQTISSDTISYVAYGTQPGWMTTSAVSSVKGSALENSFTTNVANTLHGRLPGLVTLQGSGEAGADNPTMLSRGVSTFAAGKGMFMVIDGLQAPDGYFQQLVPEEIESITLLKDAAATALYGNRGANGVLVITTKKGQTGGLKINFSAKVGFQQATRLPKFVDAYNYANLYNEALVNDGGSPLYSSEALEAYRTGSDPQLYPNVDWYDTILRDNAPVMNYNFNASGGNDVIRYFVLFNAVKSEGLYIKTKGHSDYTDNSNFVRYNFRTNVDLNLTKRLSATITVGGTIEDKSLPGNSESTGAVFDLLSSVPSNSFPIFVGSRQYGGNNTYANPLGEIAEKGYYKTNGRLALTSLRLKEDLGFITPGLSISGAIGFNSYFQTYTIGSHDYQRFSVQKFADEIELTPIGEDSGKLNIDEGKSYQQRNLSMQALLNYDRTFGIHTVSGMLMANRDELTISGHNLPYFNVGMGGRFTYAYDQRYIGEFTFGYNGSENYPSGRRFGFFPAGSIGWIATNEGFLKDNKVLTFLKLRASYGLTGNFDIGGTRYMFDQYYDWGGYYPFGDANSNVETYFEGTLANPSVTWEKERQLNVGFDATLFRKLDISFDFFNRDRRDILATPYRTIPDFVGFKKPEMNVGKVNNKGFELTARYADRINDFNYYVQGGVWYAHNEVKYNAEMLQQYSYMYRTGHRVDQPFGLQAIGFFKDQKDIDDSPQHTFMKVQPGDIKYKDMNNDGVINENDICAIGYTNLPEFTYSFNLGFAYKGFDLDANFQGVGNRTIYRSGRYYEAFRNNGNASEWALERWTPATAATATYPRLSTGENQNNYQTSSFWQENGAFLKLRSLEVGYTLPVQLVKKLSLDKVRFFLNGTNLFSFDHMDGFTDPETMSGYPAIRTMSIGVNVQL